MFCLHGVAAAGRHIARQGDQPVVQPSGRRRAVACSSSISHPHIALAAFLPALRTQTCYYAKVFEKDVPKALDILSDILQVRGRGGGRTVPAA